MTTRPPVEEFSSYYRDRFGSHSPEEYKNLRLSHIDPKISNAELRDVLEKEFRRYGKMQVEIVPQGGGSMSDRLAYVNFDRQDLARRARKSCLPKLAAELGKHLKVDPAGVIKDQDGRYIEQLNRQGALPPPPLPPLRRTPSPPPRNYYDSPRGPPPRADSRNNHYAMDYYPSPRGMGPPPSRQRSVSPLPARRAGGLGPPPRRSSLDREQNRPAQSHLNVPARDRSERSSQSGLEMWKLQEDLEGGATRMLFVGNLPGNIRNILKKVFERFGRLEDIDIKYPAHDSGPPVEEFSSYYRDRFGSHSPEEYKNLRLSHIDPKISNLELRDILEKEFRRYGEMQVEIVPQGGGSMSDRLAYVNFDRQDLARRARKSCLPKLAVELGKHLKVDPAGVIKDQDGRYVEQLNRQGALPPPPLPPLQRTPSPPPRNYYDSPRGPPPRADSRNNHYAMDYYPSPRGMGPPPRRQRSISPPPARRAGGLGPPPRRSSLDREQNRPAQSRLNAPARDRSERSGQSGLEMWKLQEDLEGGATRTLFVGNLPGNIRNILKKVFERFGHLEDIDIKYQAHDSGPPVEEFSSYYRDRFGSHLPEEYKNLRLSHIDPKISNSELRHILEKEFRHYGEMQVKIVPQGCGSMSDRLAYVNFYRPELARRARKSCLPKLAAELGKHLKVDPAGVIKDQDGRYIEQLNRRGALPPPPLPPLRRTPSPPPRNNYDFLMKRPKGPPPRADSRNNHYAMDYYPSPWGMGPPPRRQRSVSPPPVKEKKKRRNS